jgi:dihydroorotate dehydrogenase electron transfer subunit
MIQDLCPVQSVEQVARNIFVARFVSDPIARTVRPGQFINVRIGESNEPLLRRPFSVYRVERNEVEIIFDVVGKGTSALSRKQKGDRIDVLGPLGLPFSVERNDFDHGVLIGGGLGVAPLPLTASFLKTLKKPYVALLGSRSAAQLVENHLDDVRVATDDGSKGYAGNVVALAEKILSESPLRNPKVFACGPMPMLRALADLARRLAFPCEVSLEGMMGCGFGICQGCPVEMINGNKKYALMCKDGPTFDVRRIRI